MITRSIVEFCRFLRDHGFPVGIKETIDALTAASIVTIGDRQAFHSALRALLATSKEEVEFFDSLFHQYWNRTTSISEACEKRETIIVAPEGKFDRAASSGDIETDLPEKATSGASPAERLKKMDFSTIPVVDLPALEEIAFRLWRQMSMRLIRRWHLHGKNGPVDLRRTIRHSIGHGGDPMDLMRKKRAEKRTRLVTLLDVSGSMELYSAFLLRFLYALTRYFKRSDSFLFSTRLMPVSRALRNENLSEVLQDLSTTVEGWSGGTRIGLCLKDFNDRFGRKLLTKHSVVMILSDGWDTGDPKLLDEELRKIKRRVHKLIWLNPLLGLAGYEPVTRGMSAALPHADVFAPAHNLESLLKLEKHWS